MQRKILKILAINPGTRYLGVAVFEGPELLDWRVRTIKGRTFKMKLERAKAVVSEFIEKYQLNVLAIKKLHHCRSSASLNQLVARIKQLAKRKSLKVCQYPIKEVEAFFIPDGRTNKKKLAELLAARYPELVHEFNKEKANRNSYHIRMFEAVALGVVCSYQLQSH